jgi:signal peptidase II|tara:strand:- start:4777 stop:5277 length:501 start_codon:yes stop_codon:yes gene_type:complete
MPKINFKKISLNSIIVLVIFLIDRVSKIYILKIAELENIVDIYLTNYLNLYLIWNKGIAFGLLSINESLIYNSISLVIALIILTILVMLIKSNGLKRYSLILVLGGSLGNLFDRIYYSAVPDFIDFHIGNLHWFIFNVADIFITLGIICLIYVEIFFNKQNNETRY